MNDMDDSSPSYIIVEIEQKLFMDLRLHLIIESQWKPSGVSDLYHRVDAERPEMHQPRHIHIAHKKHLSAKDQQVSWATTGARHDANTFNTGFKGLNNAQDVARRVLNLGPSVLLEQKLGGRFDLLSESIVESPEDVNLSALSEAVVLVAEERRI